MPDPPPPSRLEHLAPWIAGALISLPVYLCYYPPMVDLPTHEAVVGLLRHWGNPRYVPPNVYELNIGFPNQLIYFLILPLAYVMSVGTATKLVAATSVLLFPVAVGRLARHLGVTPLAAMVLAPLGLGWMFFWGLLANIVGLDALLFALPTFDRFCRAPTARDLGRACGWIVLLYFAHELMSLLAAGLLVVFAAASCRTARDAAKCAVPVVLSLALTAVAHAIGARLTSKFHQGFPPFAWEDLRYKLTTAPSVLYASAGIEWWIRYLTFAICQLPVALYAVERWRNRTPKDRTPRDWLFDFRFEIVAGLLVVAYLVAPVNVKGTTLIYHRFLIPAWVLFTLSACTRKSLAHPRRLPRLLSVFMPIVPLLTTWPRFIDSSERYRDLDAAIAHMEPGSAYAVLHYGPTKWWYWIDTPSTGSGHIIGALGGRGILDATISEASPVFERDAVQWDTSLQRFYTHTLLWLPTYDLTRYRYVIVHSQDVSIAGVATLAMQPEAKLVFHQGEWTVLESTLPLLPLDAPDAPDPKPQPKTFGDRFLETIARVQRLPPGQQGLPFE